METKKIKPGVEYASCDGHLVVPADPVTRGWYQTTEQVKKEWVNVLKFAEQTDPWGACLDAKRPITTGIKCTRYQTDRDGKRLEDTASVEVFMPQDIKGTWSEFLTLHAEKVRREADERAKKQETHRIEKLVDEITLSVPAKLDIHFHYGWRRKTADAEGKVRSLTIGLEFADVDEFSAIVKKLGGRVPKDVVDYVRENSMTKEQFQKLLERSR